MTRCQTIAATAFCCVVACHGTLAQTVVDWAIYYDRPDFGGWGVPLDRPDLLLSSTGRYEFLDHRGRLGECERERRYLDGAQVKALAGKLVPVLRRYELQPVIRLDCTITDVGDGDAFWFRYRLDSGRTASFGLQLQPYWCGSQRYRDVMDLQEMLTDLGETLPDNCAKP